MANWAIIIGGMFLIIIAFTNGDFFPADDVGGSVSNKPIPKWLGRTGFILIGLLLIVVGMAALVTNQ